MRKSSRDSSRFMNCWFDRCGKYDPALWIWHSGNRWKFQFSISPWEIENWNFRRLCNSWDHQFSM